MIDNFLRWKMCHTTTTFGGTRGEVSGWKNGRIRNLKLVFASHDFSGWKNGRIGNLKLVFAVFDVSIYIRTHDRKCTSTFSHNIFPFLSFYQHFFFFLLFVTQTLRSKLSNCWYWIKRLFYFVRLRQWKAA